MNGSAAAKPNGPPWLLASPAALWLLVFMVAMSFWKSTMFGTRPDFQFGNYARQLSEPLYCTLMLKSLRIAAISTFIALVVSYPIAYRAADELRRLSPSFSSFDSSFVFKEMPVPLHPGAARYWAEQRQPLSTPTFNAKAQSVAR